MFINDFENNSDIGALLVKGSEKAFAAGADIKEMQQRDRIHEEGVILKPCLNYPILTEQPEKGVTGVWMCHTDGEIMTSIHRGAHRL